MCNKMSINTADFAALAVTVVLFAVIYYLDYKKGVDFGLLTLLGTVFGIAVGLGFGNHLKKISGKSIFYLILNTAIASTITVIVVFAIIIALSYNAISKENESVKPFKAFIDAGNQVIRRSG